MQQVLEFGLWGFLEMTDYTEDTTMDTTEETTVVTTVETQALEATAPEETIVETMVETSATEATEVPEVTEATEVPEATEAVIVVAERPFLTTSFEDYTVTEGFCLLLFILVLLNFILNLLRR